MVNEMIDRSDVNADVILSTIRREESLESIVLGMLCFAQHDM